MLAKLLPGADFQPQMQAEILEKAAGNPYYLEEVVRSLMEAGGVVPNVQAEGMWVVSEKISQIAVPATLHAAIIARIDRLTEDARQALQTASVIGRQFRLNLFRNVSDATEEIDIWMAQLERGGLIRPVSVSLDPEYAFPDTLVQEVAYESLLVQSRQQLHGRLGASLEAAFADNQEQGAELLAYHFSRSDDEDKALHYLEMAAKKARSNYAIETAIQAYAATLEIWRKAVVPTHRLHKRMHST